LRKFQQISAHPRVKKASVDFGPSLIADVEATEAMQPSQGAFDHPATDTEAAAMRGAPAREDGEDALRPKPIAMGLGVVAAVALNYVRLASGAAALATNPR